MNLLPGFRILLSSLGFFVVGAVFMDMLDGWRGPRLKAKERTKYIVFRLMVLLLLVNAVVGQLSRLHEPATWRIYVVAPAFILGLAYILMWNYKDPRKK